MNASFMNNGIDIRIEDAPGRALKFRHLSGKRDDTHNEGDRDFILELPEDFAEELIAAGWRVRLGKERPDGGHYPPSIKVTVRFDTVPPVIEQYTSDGCTPIDESTVVLLDNAQIDSAYLIIHPYLNEKKSRDGLKTPYLRNLRYKLEENPFKGVFEDE